MPIGHTLADSTDVHGEQNFSFRYSSNVTKVRLWSDRNLMYEGAPIEAYNLKKGPLGIEVEWNGSEAYLAVTDKCSVPALWRSFF